MLNTLPISQLTVIIPFLNEGEEVAHTVESVCRYAQDKIDILVINDASQMLYDYEEMLRPYPAVTYLRNEKRMGVAACRDMGVRQIKTPYFLFLDAHMRFYEAGWDRRLVGYLAEDDRRLLCCQTYALAKDESGDVEPIPNRGVSYGALLPFEGSRPLYPRWIFGEDPAPDKELIDTPCVFGAAYAASKRYWTYLRGLEGLIYYGYDEPYISLKVWMEGGRCQLIKDLLAGHIYRKRSPYRVTPDELMYNPLWIATLLLPDEEKENVYAVYRQQGELLFQKMMARMEENRELLQELKTYYTQILRTDFGCVKQLNVSLIKKLNHGNQN